MVRRSSARPVRGRATRGRQTKQNMAREDQVPEVYQELLEEAEARDPDEFHSDRPIKRRRVGDTKAIPVALPGPEQSGMTEAIGTAEVQQIQTVYDSTTEDESDFEDVEWEDVDVQQPVPETSSASVARQSNDETLQITLDYEPEKRKKTVRRRKPVTAAEKKLRLEVHKAHLLCLLGHAYSRNRWCNDDELQRFLKRMLPKRIVALLNPDEDKPSYARSTTFMDGLNQAADIFLRRFRVTKPGLKRAHWAEDQAQLKNKIESIRSDSEIFLSKEDFRSQAKTMQGSRDFGAQLFCAVLRAVAVEARLVCSFQPLPFSGTTKDMTPSKAGPQYIVVSSDDHETSTDERQKPEGSSPTPGRVKRIGRPEFTSRPVQTSARLGSRPTPRESSFPVYWVEAFNEGAQKWIPVDPLVTKSLAKPSKFEPPASDPYNSMSYVIAFEDDASARDVTRRYTKAFNAKTRKLRVESTRNGEKWWNDALRTYEKPFIDDRDEAEISELTSKTAAEPMPRNIQDFKDHPIYALERHLHRNEVIFPKRVIGHVGLSKTTSKSDNLDPVYRRSDVHIVRSADKWYRLGRDVKVGEQPLKHVRAARPKSGFLSDEEEAEPKETALYAECQTEVYRPPPVVNGRIPKNAYGNLDIYVPSMVPPGAIHIKRPDAGRAARLLGIDYADAVTGFEFRGRRGTAIFGGIVIACEYQEALEEVLRSFVNEKQRAALEARSAEALRFWKLFLIKLRIAERVKSYAADDEEVGDAASEMSVGEAEEAGGGFFPEPDQPVQSPPPGLIGMASGTRNASSKASHAVDTGQLGEDLGGGFMPEEPEAEDEGLSLKPSVANDGQGDSASGGGFLPGSIDDGLTARASMVAEQSSASQGSKKPKHPNPPRYELIVVPSDAKSTIEERPGTVELPASKEGTSDQVPITVDSSTSGDSISASVDILSRPPSPQRSRPRSPPPKESDSEIEKGSLLSEDPEDEDAVPDWLMFDE